MNFRLIFVLFLFFLSSNLLFSQGSERIDSLINSLQIQKLENTSLKLTWIKQKNKSIENLAIYRSQTKLSASSLYTEKPLIIISADDEVFIDTNILEKIDMQGKEPSLLYYYLISIDAEKNSPDAIIPLIIPGFNMASFYMTNEQSQIANKTTNNVEPKQIMLNTDERTIFPLPKKNLSTNEEKTEDFLAQTQSFERLQNNRKTKLLITKVQIFDDDLKAKAGEAYLLAEILEKQLVLGRYKEAEDAIRSFLMIHRSQEMRYKSLFYLAQALYFQELYVDALYYFIECQNYLFDVSRDWIDACLYILSE